MIINKKEKVIKIIAKLQELFPNVKTALNYSNNWEFLVAVILSAQTTDKQVNKVTEKLFKKYKHLEDYVYANPAEFEQDIHSVNFHHNKAVNILKTAQMIKENFKGQIPQTMEDLITLPGVGRKTANVILGNAFGTPVGIAVDTHVARLSQLLGLTTHNTSEKIEQDLITIVPQEYWTTFTHLMIEYGRTYCSARRHDHTICPLYTYETSSK